MCFPPSLIIEFFGVSSPPPLLLGWVKRLKQTDICFSWTSDFWLEVTISVDVDIHIYLWQLGIPLRFGFGKLVEAEYRKMDSMYCPSLWSLSVLGKYSGFRLAWNNKPFKRLQEKLENIHKKINLFTENSHCNWDFRFWNTAVDSISS